MERMEQIDPPSRGLSLGVKTTALVVAIGVVVLIGELAVHEAGVTRVQSSQAATVVDDDGGHTTRPADAHAELPTLQAGDPDAPVPTF